MRPPHFAPGSSGDRTAVGIPVEGRSLFKTVRPSHPAPSLAQRLQAAVRARADAESAFDWAPPALVDHTVYRLLLAEEEIALILRQARGELMTD